MPPPFLFETPPSASLNRVRIMDLPGLPLDVRLIHDGTAASLAHAGRPNSAVIVVGTALGVGFPPPSAAGLADLQIA